VGSVVGAGVADGVVEHAPVRSNNLATRLDRKERAS